MRWLQTEYILKGIYLGLLLDVALRQAERPATDWSAPLTFAACTLGGLLLALTLAALWKLRQGYRIRGRLAPFILFLLLESPTLVYVGILGGTLLGAWLIREGETDPLFVQMVGGGAALGLLFWVLRHVRERRVRLGLSLAMAAGLMGIAVYWFGLVEGVTARYKIENQTVFGVFLLLGLPIFYLLTFAGQEEETEIEVGAMCATLGLGLALVTQESQQVRSLGFILPVVLYFWYTFRVLPGLRVFKYVLRGISHASVGRYRPALLAFRRALQLDPNNRLARDEFWNVHVKLDFNQLARDPQLLALVDFTLCVERAGSLLLQPNPPPNKLADAHRLLDLVLNQRPALQPTVAYWRAVALTHERKFDEAVGELEWLLDPALHEPGDANRQMVLMPAWQLVLMVHDELRHRVGQPQLALPGRRIEAIAAVERHLAESRDDASVLPLKRLLYQDLSEEEFEAACDGDLVPAAFDYAYAQQLGTALLADPDRWERGAAYLHMALRGLPALAPGICIQLAEAFHKAGQDESMWKYLRGARQAGVAVGHKNLPDQEKHNYFWALKQLGEEAMGRGDVDAALENFNLYAEYERSGIETLRTIAQLYEQKEDALAALRVTDRALQFNAKDKDLLARRDRYYVSVTPEVLRANLETVQKEFDADYCLRKAKELLDFPEADLDVVDWAEHLIDLALVVKSESRAAKVMKARARWRRGEIGEAGALLEEVRTPKPEKFGSTDEEEAWYVSCQLLGDLYLNNLGKPEQAIACLNDFKKSPKSGAKTLYRLGQAYEALGDTKKAVRCYQQVTAYEGNPLAPDAQDALDRLGHRAS
ncbi:MAG: tetratricopeptide repeat protein [Planctomycetes bacterium]|nr:tetratricopeptide repeat protein [Planctomycetota bacterium]